MGAVSRFVLRHKLAVVLFWLAVLAAGAVASAKLSGRHHAVAVATAIHLPGGLVTPCRLA